MEIAENTVVSLRYNMRNFEGEEIENTLAGPAVQYIHGSGKILPELESQLQGLKAGAKKSITIGLSDTFYFDVEVDEVRMATPVEIETGKPLAANSCGPVCCC
jgi:FKBP-type peptidyl-prolyl cis-trans isomerase SlyD